MSSGPHALSIAALVALLAIAAPARAAPATGQAVDTATVCRDLIAAAEARHGLPKQLLGAVALAESGRWDGRRREISAWPWTIYAEGRGRRFETKAKAAAALRRLRRSGVANIDVGCMQVNLMYHGDAFAAPAAALDPARNVEYAAGLLKRLYRETRSWGRAVAFYHSRTPALGGPYRTKVFDLWQRERRRIAALRRDQVRRAYLARKAAWQARRRR